jgi:hypothetical protein
MRPREGAPPGQRDRTATPHVPERSAGSFAGWGPEVENESGKWVRPLPCVEFDVMVGSQGVPSRPDRLGIAPSHKNGPGMAD